MELSTGQKVAYPGQGVCEVEEVGKRNVGGCVTSCYLLRVLGDDSHILVPVANAETVGIRSLISRRQCRRLIDRLSEDFEDVSTDWKTRSKQFAEKLQSGDVFEAAEVLKKLTFLSHGKKLSFREQTLLEKAKFLIVSEITNAQLGDSNAIEPHVCELVESACTKHLSSQLSFAVAGVH